MSNKLRSKGRFRHYKDPGSIFEYKIKGDRVDIRWKDDGGEGVDYSLNDVEGFFEEGIWVLELNFNDYLKQVENE